jgi:methylenetetrahydrofolate dehydrogenase (NADP+) / methenyltetrahydrofolate cyclohydrolase
MVARLIDGKATAAALRVRVAEAAANLSKTNRIIPGLAAVLVGDDPASEIYVRNKVHASRMVEDSPPAFGRPASALR